MGSSEFLRQETCTEYIRQNTNTGCTDKTNKWYLRQRRQLQTAQDRRHERRVYITEDERYVHNTEDAHFVRRVPNAVQSRLTKVEDYARHKMNAWQPRKNTNADYPVQRIRTLSIHDKRHTQSIESKRDAEFP